MKEQPIIFQDWGIRAILDGTKTQTRRIVQMVHRKGCMWKGDESTPYEWIEGADQEHSGYDFRQPCQCIVSSHPYGVPGDLLRVRETWRIGAWAENDGVIAVDYRADNYARREWLHVTEAEQFERLWIDTCDELATKGILPDANGQYHWEPGMSPCRWRPSIHMPHWASRLTLRLTDERIQRVQDISREDAVAEGVADDYPGIDTILAFHRAWDAINAKRGYGWEMNPWVRALTFEVAK